MFPQTFLTLCAVQATNGTAGNATTYAPLSYITADDPDTGITAAITSAGVVAVSAPTLGLAASASLVVILAAFAAA